jgi:hypothetical protein
MISITSKKEGFRRCGIAHSTKATVYPDDRFTEDEFEALSAEPMLTVDIVDEEETPAPETKTAEPKKAKGK